MTDGARQPRGARVKPSRGASETVARALSRDGARVGTLDSDGAVEVRSLATAQVVASLRASPGARGLALSDDGARVAVCGAEGRARAWALASGERLTLSEGARCGARYEYKATSTRRRSYSARAGCMRFSPDGQALLLTRFAQEEWEYYYGGGTADTESRAVLHALAGGEQPVTLHADRCTADYWDEVVCEFVVSAAFSGAQDVTLCTNRGELLRFDRTRGAETRPIVGARGHARVLASALETPVVACVSDDELLVWSELDRAPRALRSDFTGARALALDRVGALAAVVTQADVAWIDLERGRVLARRELGDGAALVSLAFTASGGLVGLGSDHELVAL